MDLQSFQESENCASAGASRSNGGQRGPFLSSIIAAIYMNLEPGRQFGSYEVLNLIGAGGMGEVYRARDMKLKREVAIKSLPAAFSNHPDRVARFQREAEVLASLNHPNIGAIHHLEEAEGSLLLILELVEGETLADKIARGPLPVDDALKIAKQIADAMEAAHAQGIVHRDLKPANVKITKLGNVKVLDFGLAKIYEPEHSAVSSSQSPTLMSGTMSGALMGTAAYMSPEQARGQEADAGSDVWAFGCVLYEMLTGKSPFGGETLTDILASVVKTDPDWTALKRNTPPAVRRLLLRCLKKDRRQRLRDMGDAALDIDEALNTNLDPAVTAGAAERAGRYAWPIAIVAIVIAIAAIIGQQKTAAPETQQIRFAVHPPQRFFVRGESTDFALSPDGRHLAFIAEDTTRKIWLRSLNSAEARPLAGTENARTVFWSPDSHYIAFVTGLKLSKISIADGQTQAICDIDGFPGAAWSSKNEIVFSSDGNLFHVSGNGGSPRPLAFNTGHPDGERGAVPSFLPDGDHLFIARTREPDRGVWAVSITSNERKQILPFATRVAYSTTGHLLYLRDRKLFAQPFDPKKLELSGEPIVLENESQTAWFGNFSLSSNGIVPWAGPRLGAAQWAWPDRTGQKTKLWLPGGLYRQVRLSTNASRTAVAVTADAGARVWILELSSGIFSRLTTNTGNENDMVWSPDGRELAFSWHRNLYRKTLGAADVIPVLENNDEKWLHDWSPDGRFVIFAHDKGVYAVPPSGKGETLKLIENNFGNDEFRVSPDNKWIAFNSDESGRSEVYVSSFPSMNNRRQISNSGGGIPRWRGDMREMYYMRTDGTLMGVDVRPGDVLETGAPRAMFRTQVPFSSVLDQYDVTADGKRFLVIENEDEAVSPPINVVINWLPDLKKTR